MGLLRRHRPGRGELGDRIGLLTTFWLNTIVGSSLLHWRVRGALLRMSGVGGRRLRLFPGVRFAGSRDVRFGERVVLNTGVLLDAGAPIVLGDDVHMGPDARLLTATHTIGSPHRRCGDISFLPVSIGDGVWIGAGATVLAGVSIGDGCVIAAGAVVANDCEPNGLYGGIPARRIRDLDDAVSEPAE